MALVLSLFYTLFPFESYSGRFLVERHACYHDGCFTCRCVVVFVVLAPLLFRSFKALEKNC